jgi:antitoxin CptB
LQQLAHIKDAKKDIESRRLAWRCRRGLLELDIVLQRFVANHFYDLSQSELVAFDGLLAMPDNEFWDLISNNSLQKNAKADVALQLVINKLNAK